MGEHSDAILPSAFCIAFAVTESLGHFFCFMMFTISASTATHIYSNSGIYPPIINRLTKKYAFSITCSLSKISMQKFGLFYKLVYICKRNINLNNKKI